MFKRISLSILLVISIFTASFVTVATERTDFMYEPQILDIPLVMNYTLNVPQIQIGDYWKTHRYAVEIMYQGYPMYIWDNKTYTVAGINETVECHSYEYQCYNFTLSGDVIAEGEGDQYLEIAGFTGMVHYYFTLNGQVNGFVLLRMSDLARIEVHFTVTGVPVVTTDISAVNAFLAGQNLYYTENVNFEYSPASNDFGFPTLLGGTWLYSGNLYKYGSLYLEPLMPAEEDSGADYYPYYHAGNNITMEEATYTIPQEAYGNYAGEAFDTYKFTARNESGYYWYGGDPGAPPGGKKESWFSPEVGFIVAERVEDMCIGEAAYVQFSEEYLMDYRYSQPGPEILSTAAVPNTVLNNNENLTLLSALVTDPDGLLNIKSVKADLGAIGGGQVGLWDDGTHGDPNSHDGNFSLAITIPKTVTPDQSYSIPITVKDASGATHVSNIQFYVAAWNHDPEIVSADSTLDTVPNDGSTTTLLTVSVTDMDGLEDILSVEVDLSSIGGSATQGFTDTGTMGDETAGDGIYSYIVTIPDSVSSGSRSLPVTVTDSKDVAVSGTLLLTVENWNHPPKLTNVILSKEYVKNDNLDTILITVNVADDEENLDRVTIDLSKVSGGFLDPMYDDGTHGDASSGDGIYSLEITVPKTIGAGTYELQIRAVDDETLSSTTNFLLEVQASKTPASLQSVLASPAQATNSGNAKVFFTVRIADPENRVQNVFIDLSPLGGEAFQLMLDDGSVVSGDQNAGDGVYSYTYTVPKTANPGTYNITAKVTSTVGEPSLGYVSVTITQASTDGGDGGDGDGGDGDGGDGDDFVPPTAKDDDESSKKKESTPGFHAVDLLLVAGVLAILILIARRRRL